MQKIAVKHPLVVLQGDEMADVAFRRILEQFVDQYLDIQLIDMDLTVENRLRTNGKVIDEAIEALCTYGVGIKNAGVTVNQSQLTELLDIFNSDIQKEGEKLLEPFPDEVKERYQKEKDNFRLTKSDLAGPATKSPNGRIRKGINGNITRERIPLALKPQIPDWKDRDITVLHMYSGGKHDSYNDVIPSGKELELRFTDSSGKEHSLHSRPIGKETPVMLAVNDAQKVREATREAFKRALDEEKDIYCGAKDTVIPGYDGVLRKIMDEVAEEYAEQFAQKGLRYEYGLIDAQAAKMIATPPESGIWFIPDAAAGKQMATIVEALKRWGMPQDPRSEQARIAVSRMSAGGGDQYGSYNLEAKEAGTYALYVDGNKLQGSEKEVAEGDPMLLMTNDRDAIWAWVEQTLEESRETLMNPDIANQEVYFGMNTTKYAYDRQFRNIIRQVLDTMEMIPPMMILRSSDMASKMLTDPPRSGRYASLNLDGDVFSDIVAALSGSLATADSKISGVKGGKTVKLFEAPHGTAPDLYEKYIKSDGKEMIFNPTALLWALANALEAIADTDENDALKDYAKRLKAAMITVVDKGIITGDLKGKTLRPDKEKLVDLPGFMDAVEAEL